MKYVINKPKEASEEKKVALMLLPFQVQKNFYWTVKPFTQARQ